jgi:hypothetical protein
MVKPALAEPQSWRNVPILRDGVIARRRLVWTRRYDAPIQPAPEPAWRREGSDERGTYRRSDDQRQLGDGLPRESDMVTER